MYIDFHNDTVLKIVYGKEDFKGGSKNMHVDLPKIRAVKMLKGLFFAVWSNPVFRGEDGFANTLQMLNVLKKTLHQNERYISIATSRDDVKKILDGEKVMAILAVEGGHSIDNNLGNLIQLYKEGVRLLTLTHSKSTEWAGSAHEKDQRGLSDLGIKIIKTMNELGMIIDLAHVNSKTIFDVIKVSKQPVVCSHGAARGVYEWTRALDDDTIKAIASTGGVIGIIFFPEFLTANPFLNNDSTAAFFAILDKIENDDDLSPIEMALKSYHILCNEFKIPQKTPGVDAVFKHINYIVNLVGDDHVAIGSDFDGVPYCCSGLEDISKLGNLADFMVKMGYSEKRIQKIMGGNILRIINTVLK